MSVKHPWAIAVALVVCLATSGRSESPQANSVIAQLEGQLARDPEGLDDQRPEPTATPAGDVGNINDANEGSGSEGKTSVGRVIEGSTESSSSLADEAVASLKGGSVRLMLMLGLFSLAPAAFLMTTSYVRIVVVLTLLKQALGNQQALPAQATTALALFMTALIMTPVWQDVYFDAVKPYHDSQGEMSVVEAWHAGIKPVRQFMSRQIEGADNSEDVWLFFRYLPEEQQSNPPQTYDDVPLQVLLPAFLVSELKTAFLIGFRIYLPFLVLDFVIAAVTTSMGLSMLPPATISFPFKLMLFVLVDGWRLIAGTLLDSFGAVM